MNAGPRNAAAAPAQRARFPLAARALRAAAARAPADVRAAAPRARAPALAQAKTRSNWALYAFLFLLPLQNIHAHYLPNLGGGVNFLNTGFVLSLAGAFMLRGRLAPGEAVNRWSVVYILYSIVSLFVGYHYVSNTESHFNILKDHLIGLSLLYLVQMSANDWPSVRRIVLATLLPLPYIAKVTLNQHYSVASWNYSDDLRIKGTFMLLGANEFAAFCVTMLAVTFALLVAARASRRWKLVLAGGLACMVACVLFAYSRTAYIAALLGIASVVVVWRGRMKLVLPLFLAAAIATPLLPASVVERFDSTHVEEGQRDESTEKRFEFWAIAWRNFVEHPVVGTGFQSFRHPEINPYAMDTHNVYLRTLTEGGIVGGVVFLGLMLSVLRLALREIAAAATGTWRYALALGLLGAWLGMACGNLFGDRFTYYPLAAIFWTYVALVMKARRLPPEAAKA